jgi:hypothetical protein
MTIYHHLHGWAWARTTLVVMMAVVAVVATAEATAALVLAPLVSIVLIIKRRCIAVM